MPLEEVPPLVFSEVMRDADLFVGVASIGNDPDWHDGGAGAAHPSQWRHAAGEGYWRDYAFGELTEAARTRRDVLATILPKLRIAGRCRLDERYLSVEGRIRTYRIHLGSGNILMAPDDRYLCIVPAQAKGTEGPVGLAFVPFEGDRTLSLILSKALLLAEDRKIKDESILRQLR